MRLTLDELVSGQDGAKVPVQKQLIIPVTLFTHLAVTARTAVKLGDLDLSTSQNLSQITNTRGGNPAPGDGIEGGFNSHVTFPTSLDPVYDEASVAFCFPLRTGFFQLKLGCISASMGLHSFERECFRSPQNSPIQPQT